jgi:hypothetical protein
MTTTFVLSWDLDPNRTPSQANLVQQCKYYLWYFSHLIKGDIGGMTQGLWTCLGSSDAVTAGLDGVDRWTAAFDATKIVRAAAGVAHSWITMQSPVTFGNNTGPYYFTIDYSTGIDSTVTIAWSKTAPTGGTTLNRPTSVDEWTNVNTQFAQNPLITSTVQGWLAATGDFMFTHCPIAAPASFPLGIGFFTLFNCKPGDLVQVSSYFDFLSFFSQANLINVLAGPRLQTRDVTNTATRSLTLVSPSVNIAVNTQMFAAINMGGTDAADGAYDDFSIWMYVNNAGQLSLKGRLPDIYWSPDSLAQASVEPTTGPPYDSAKIGSVWVPWPASVQVTNFALNEVTRSQSASGGAGAGGGATTYIMEAIDSVTLGLFHWNSGTTPDFAGVGYPGPNSPTLIAISQVN